MDDKENQLVETKKKLKRWEYYFMKCHERKPTKSDIDAGPEDIKASYLLYTRLKDTGATARLKDTGATAGLKDTGATAAKSPDSQDVVWGEHVSIKALERTQSRIELSATGEPRPAEIIETQENRDNEGTWAERFTQRLFNRDNSLKICPKTSFPLPTQINKPKSPVRPQKIDPDLSCGDESNKSEGGTAAPSLLPKHHLKRRTRRCAVPKGWREQVIGSEEPTFKNKQDDSSLTSADSSIKGMVRLANVSNSGGETSCVMTEATFTKTRERSTVDASNACADIWLHKGLACNNRTMNQCSSRVPKSADPNVKTSAAFIERPGSSSYRTTAVALDRLSPRMPSKANISQEQDAVPRLKEDQQVSDPYRFDEASSPVRTGKRTARAKAQVKAKVTQGKIESIKQAVPKKRKATVSEETSSKDVSASNGTKKPRVSTRCSSKVSNDNFVKLNLRKKVYARGKTGLKGAAYKRQQWKNKMSAKRGTACFKCGEEGHWANKCTNMAKSSQVTDTFNEDVDGFLVDKPVDEYLDDLMYGAYSGAESTITSGLATGRSCEPLFEECVTQSECREKILQTLNKVFGFTSFRPGQLDTIERLLRGKSTLVMLSTGAGKSLCYQLAAYMYAQRDPCVAMVISPLVSLMEDQVVDLPKGVKGVCLHTNQTETARAKFMSAVVDGKVHFMLCSPEFLCSTSSSNIEFFNKIPPISFACIDEAHCLSQWSHNFRPSYLRVCKILRVRFGVQCFLGLTATASQETITQITSFLNLDNLREGCIKGNLLPPNLNLSVSKDNNKEQALLDLLQSERFRNCQSIIIYCTRRERTDSLASLIRSTLPGETTAKVPVAESYHAGLTAAKRRGVQKLFMNGKLRIVVATVAFGMGLDKSDVRAVIHYNIPKGFESYIQEIGRAGRDGLPAECHVFLEPEGTDIAELEKHTYADSVDQSSVRKLLSMLYQPCKCQMLADSMKQVSQCDTIEGNVAGSVCPGHERPIVLQSAISQLNATEQVIATLLFYLELQNPHWLENLSSVYSSCTIKCYGSSEELHTAAKKCIPLGVALALSKKRSDERIGRELTFDILEVSNLLNKPSGFIKKELRQLQWIQTTDGKFKRTGLIVEFGNLAMRVRAPGNLDEEELDYIHAFLKNRVISQENKELKRLHYFYHTLSKIAYKDYFMVSEEAHSGRSDSLKSCIVHYFEDEEPTKDYVVPERVTDSAAQTYISSQVTSFISTYGHENEFSGRDVAKILYGIASPNYPPNIWGRVRRFWRSLLGYDFNLIVKIATERLILTSRF